MVDNNKLLQILENIGDRIIENKMFLNDLDTAIGDGDHGINMARGFTNIKEKLKDLQGKDCATILNTVAMTLISTVGGASGPLYGTAFMKSAAAVKGKENLDSTDLLNILKASIDGVQMRGKAVKGEKTILDSLIPAYEVYEKALNEGNSTTEALEQAVIAAKEGVEYTKTIKATKGRASYLGDRSIGHADPGATSSKIILEALLEAL
jgi:dihydroxyacetone kinase-like protein